MNERIYGVIAEHKLEQPLIIESKLMTLDEAYTRMQEISKSTMIIRSAIFKMEYVNGNEAIIEKEKTNV